MAKGFQVGDKVKISYIYDLCEHNGKIGKITWLGNYNYYPNGDLSVIEKRTQATILYENGKTMDVSDIYHKGSGLVSPAIKISN